MKNLTLNRDFKVYCIDNEGIVNVDAFAFPVNKILNIDNQKFPEQYVVFEILNEHQIHCMIYAYRVGDYDFVCSLNNVKDVNLFICTIYRFLVETPFMDFYLFNELNQMEIFSENLCKGEFVAVSMQEYLTDGLEKYHCFFEEWKKDKKEKLIILDFMNTNDFSSNEIRNFAIELGELVDQDGIFFQVDDMKVSVPPLDGIYVGILKFDII